MSARWEPLTDEMSNRLDRFKVPGGWLYRTMTFAVTGEIAVAMVFVPIPPGIARAGDD